MKTILSTGTKTKGAIHGLLGNILRNTSAIEQSNAKLEEHDAEIAQLKRLLLSQEKNPWGVTFHKEAISVIPNYHEKNEARGLDILKYHVSGLSKYISNQISLSSNIKNSFKKLVEDFDNISNRIAWCKELEINLSKLEEELEQYDAKYLSWLVSSLKDIFTYNYAEEITETQLDLLRNGVNMIYEEQENCDKKTFEEYHLQLVESGLALLPTTEKAIKEFGE